MSQPFDIHKNNIKQSYQRFLSDSAPGFVAIALLAIAYNSHYSFFGADIVRMCDAFGKIGTYHLLLITLLAVPLGGVINTGSWFLLGGILGRLESIWLSVDTVTRRVYDVQRIITLYGVDSSSWFLFCESIDNIMLSRYSNITGLYEHVKGYDRLLRSLMFLLLISLANSIINHCCDLEKIAVHILGYLIVLIILAVANIQNAFYYSAAILHHSCLICKSTDSNLENTLALLHTNLNKQNKIIELLLISQKYNSDQGATP